MTTRTRTVGIAFLAAAAAAAGLGFLLFGRQDLPGTGEQGAPAVERRAGRRDAAPSAINGDGPPPAAAADAAASPATVPAEGPSVEVRVLLGGVEPVEGCPVMGAERDADGEWLACFDESGPESGKTDGDGRFALRWRAEPPERLLIVFLDPGAEVDRFEGAEVVGHLREIHPVLRAGTDPVVVHLRDREGVVRLRLLDDRTGRPLEATTKPVLQFEVPDLPGTRELQTGSLRHEAGGWWMPPPVDPACRDLRLRVAGYRDLAIDPSELAGRRTLRLSPSGTGVRGTVEADVKGFLRMDSVLHRVDGGEAAGPDGILGEIDAPGPFLLDGLEPGEWELEVRFTTGAPASPARTWAVRRFTYEGKELDLGVLRPGPGVSLRVRWTPGSRDVPEGARLALARKDRETVEAATIAPEGGAAQEGWTLFQDLRPAGEYLVQSPEVPGWRETVRAPAQAGEDATYEAGRDLRLVKCRITFVEDGKKPGGLLHLKGPFRPRDFDTETCVLVASLPPGRHRFSGALIRLEKRPDGVLVGESLRPLHADVEVPEGTTWESTVELQGRREE